MAANHPRFDSSLPPMPKLRPKPGYELEEAPRKPTEQGTTSRLLMKNECRGSGRKKANGSLVHSIPKFTQVKPNERLTEVQKVLQNRIRLKQQRKRMEEEQLAALQRHQNDHLRRITSRSNGASSLLLEEHQRIPVTVPGLSGVEMNLISPILPAASLLQNIISYHEKKQVDAIQALPRTSSEMANERRSSTHKRRGRKPAKEEICHFVSDPNLILRHGQPLPQNPRPQHSRVPTIPIPQLSEVTITPTFGPRADSSSQRESALDLRTREARDPSPERLEVSVDPEHMIFQDRRSPVPFGLPPMLTPGDFESLGAPPGYLFEPRSGFFVHPSALHMGFPSMFLPPSLPDLIRRAPTFHPNPPPGLSITPSKPVTSPARMESMQSLQSVLRYKPRQRTIQEPELTVEPSGNKVAHCPSSPNKRKDRPNSSDNGQEVSICKFKFTGGAKPSLEERKMLSVDSIGNFKYFKCSGSGIKSYRGTESMPLEVMENNAKVVTDIFSSLTDDKVAKVNLDQLEESHHNPKPSSPGSPS